MTFVWFDEGFIIFLAEMLVPEVDLILHNWRKGKKKQTKKVKCIYLAADVQKTGKHVSNHRPLGI